MRQRRNAPGNLGERGMSLVDGYGRKIVSLRVSVTDRCNLRCTYCVPPEGMRVCREGALLTFAEIERVVRVAARLGVTRVRLTGGEPLLRPGLADLVARLTRLEGVEEVSLTTNGVYLAKWAEPLRRAGL
ncbi:MAG: radical SAM protein, partial [Armatimonadota bacterium]|nr:radical SAM protein [Armatimonadota bacterium]